MCVCVCSISLSTGKHKKTCFEKPIMNFLRKKSKPAIITHTLKKTTSNIVPLLKYAE